ncbi:hypothetical protein SAMN05216383_13921 [Prevotella sp. KH2C16]|nr:hypothetical protein SAMN05216383_1121 [Prevotella sp. KH2C16]SFG75749.1 hypothetical protein SAMN05216383_13921 [Prevotella sp. KH2C16]
MASSVTSSRYTAGDEGLGYSLYESEDGTGTLEVDNLKVRRQMSIAELEVRKKTYTSGNLSLGKAGNTIFAVKSFRQDGTPIADMVFAVGGAAIAVQDGSVTVLGKVSENETPSWYRCYFLRTDGERTVDNCWKAGDQAKCQTSNLTEGTTHNAANRYYWRLVVGKGTETLEDGREYHYVDLSNEESPVVEMPMIIKGEALAFYGKEDDMPDWDGITARYNLVPKAGDVYLYAHEDGAGTQPEVITYTTDTEYTVLVPEQDDIYRTADGRYYSADLDYNGDLWIETTAAAQVLQGYDPSADNDAPMTGDDIAQEGNQVDKGRQGLLVIDADDGISKYRGIDGFTYEGKRRQHIGDTVELEVNRLTIVSEAPDGTPEEHRVPCYMGAWTARPYPYYSQVDCDGSIWLCTRPAGATVADRPQDGSAVWHKQVGRGEKGDKGEQGNAVSSYTFFRYSDDGGQTFTAAKPWAETGEYGNGRNLYIGKRACEFNGIPNQYSFALPEGVVNAVSGQKVTLSAYVEGENLNDPSVSHYMVDLYFKFADGTGVWSNFNKNAQFKNADTIPGMRYSRTIDLSGHVLTEISHTNISLSKREGEPLASGVRLVIKDIKIEIGDTATEYTPAPEDQQFGLTTGAWLGVAAWDRPYPPMEASAYSWSEVKGTDGQSAEIYRLRAGTEKAQVDGSGNLTVNLSYQIEHVRGATTKMEDASASGMKVRYRGDTGTPADTVMGYGDTPSASYVLEDYTHVPHPDYIIVELLNKDGNVLDRRTVPVTFSAVAALDINGQVGEISARVQGMAGGGRNLLKGTAFEREHPDWFELRGGAPIWPSVKHGGHNSVDCSLTGMTGDMYKGAYFRAEVEPGKKYTASVWSHGDPASFDKDAVIEVSYAADTQGGRTILATESIRPSELRVWQRFHKTFTVPQGVYEIEVNFFNIRNGGMQIAEPMLTSGNMLVDWQPAPEDAEAFLTELKMSITNLSLSITDLKTGLEAVGIHLFSTERPNIRFVGNSVAYYDTTGKMFMSQGVGPGGEVYFIIYDKDGVTPLYNLGRMGMQQIIGHATPYSMEESNRLGPIPPGTVLTAVELWSDLQTTQYGTLRHTSWLYTEAYTLDGQGGRLYQYGGVYNGMYDSPAVDGDNKPTGNRLPEDGQGAYIGVWDTSDPSGHLHSTAIVYNYPNEEGKAAERLKVSLLKDYYGAGQDRYLLSLNGGDYTEQMTVPLIAIRP